MVAIDDELGGDGRHLEEDRLGPAPQEANVRLKKNRVAQSVRAGQHVDRAASPPRDVIHRGLDDFIRGTHEVCLLRANREHHTLLPVRFDSITEDSPWVGVLGKVVCPRETRGGVPERPALKSLRLIGWCHGLSCFENGTVTCARIPVDRPNPLHGACDAVTQVAVLMDTSDTIRKQSDGFVFLTPVKTRVILTQPGGGRQDENPLSKGCITVHEKSGSSIDSILSG